jgi:hypothetical protein
MNLDPSTIQGTLLWGVIAGIMAGIFTSVLLLFLTAVITKICLPWYQTLVYEGVDLQGTWTQDFGNETAKYVFHMELKQAAHTLHGSATMVKSEAGQIKYTQPFTVKGSTWEGCVQLTFRSSGRKSLSWASALAKIGERGDRLTGHWAYRAAYQDVIETEAFNWQRAKGS